MTEHDQCAFEDALRLDLTAARQQNMVLIDQLREANTLNEALSYKIDFLTSEVARVTSSREQYERVAIRVSAKMEGATAMMIKQLQDLQDEIKTAAFAKVPGAIPRSPAASVDDPRPHTGEPEHAPSPSVSDIDIEKLHQIGRNFGAGFEHSPLYEKAQGSAGLLPPARFGNGAVKS